MAKAMKAFTAKFIEETPDYQNILLYSDYGAGKTTLAATSLFVPDMCDILFVSLESGEKALRQVARWAKQKGIDPNRLLVIPVETFQQYAQVYEFLKIHLDARDRNDLNTLRALEAQIRNLPMDIRQNPELLAEAVPNPLKFRTVIVDSLSEAQKYCMYQVLGIDPATQRIDEEPDKAEWTDWGHSREMIQFLVRRLRDLPINAIFTAGEAIDKDNKNIFHYDVALPGKLAGDVRGLVDTVGYILEGTDPVSGAPVRRLILKAGTYMGTKEIKAKNRYGDNLKQNWIDNPTMYDLYNLGKLEQENGKQKESEK